MMHSDGAIFRCSWRILQIAISLCLCVASGHAESLSEPAFRRGIAVSHVFPPFQSSAAFGEELKSIKRAGFDFVRLVVDPGPFLHFRGSQRDLLDEILIDRVKL